VIGKNMERQLLRSLKPRDMDRLLRSMAGYTRFVLFSKTMLWGVALGLASLIVILPLINKDQTGVRIVFSNVEMTESQTMPKMMNPRYQGVSEKNEPYSVTADYALQAGESYVELHNLKADITMQDAHWAALTADDGTLDISSQTAFLKGKVKLFHDAGYSMETEDVTLKLKQSTADSQKIIRANGPLGSLEAAGFTVSENGMRILFNGPVRVVLYTEQGGKS